MTRSLALSLALLLASCSGTPPAEEGGPRTAFRTGALLPAARAPYRAKPLAGDIPAVPWGGRLHVGSELAPGTTGVIAGQFTDATDLFPADDAIAVTVETWLAWLTWPDDIKQSIVPPKLGERVKDLEAAVATSLDASLGEEALGLAIKLLRAFAGSSFTATPEKPKTEERFYGRRPHHARWLTHAWHKQADAKGIVRNVRFSYGEPSAFADVRSRAARVYCAAREVARKQLSPRRLAHFVAFSFQILGEQVDLLSFTATAYVRSPTKLAPLDVSLFHTGDGVGTYTVPLDLGVVFHPIDAYELPALAELRIPVVLGAVDAEVQVGTNRRTMDFTELSCSVGLFGGAPGCTQKSTKRSVYTRSYRTASFADFWMSKSLQQTLGFKRRIFWVGPFPVDLEVELGLDFGTPTLPMQDHVLAFEPGSKPVGFPDAPRIGLTLDDSAPYGDYYSDGPWLAPMHTFLRKEFWETEPVLGPGSLGGPFRLRKDPTKDQPSDPTVKLEGRDPYLVRASQADDLALAFRTGVEATLTPSIGTPPIVFTVDVGIGDAKVSLWAEAAASLAGKLGMEHQIRDAMMAESVGSEPLAASSITVSAGPYGGAKFSFDVFLRFMFDLSVDLGFWDVEVHVDEKLSFVDYSHVLLEKPAKPGPENRRLRIGTGGNTPDARERPAVTSHLPVDISEEGSEKRFDAFPDSVSVCLEDESPVPPPPPPCQPATPPPFEVPRALPCLYSEVGQLPPEACGNIVLSAAIKGGSAKAQECTLRFLEFYCSGIHKFQTFDGAQVVARRWDVDHEKTPAAVESVRLLAVMTKACLESVLKGEDGKSTDAYNAEADAWFASTMKAAVCLSDATLVKDPITTSTPKPIPECLP